MERKSEHRGLRWCAKLPSLPTVSRMIHRLWLAIILGSTTPLGFLGQPALSQSVGESQTATQHPPIVAKIVEAAGGEANLLTRFTIQERLNVSDDPTAPGKPRESIFDGRHDWWFRGGKGKWKKKQDEPAVDLVWVWTLQALVHPQSIIEELPEIQDGEERAVGIRISGSIDPPLDAYFDGASMRLVRIDWRRDTTRFSDWKEHQGVKYPSRCIGYRKATGKPWYVSEIVELRRLSELPEGLPQ